MSKASLCNYLIREQPLENNTKMGQLHVIFPCFSLCWSSWIIYLLTTFSILAQNFCSFMEVTNDHISICLYLCFHFDTSFHTMVADKICVLGEYEQQLMWKGSAWTVVNVAHVGALTVTLLLLSLRCRQPAGTVQYQQ